MELLAKLASAERELQDLRRCQESRTQDPLDSSRDPKPDPAILSKLETIQTSIRSLHQQIFLAKSEVMSKITSQFSSQIARITNQLTGAPS